VTKSELITALLHQSHLGHRDVERVVSTLLDHMSQTLAHGRGIEIRGFGSFSLNYHPACTGRNPVTGDEAAVPAKCVPHFRPGKALRERIKAV